MTQDKLRSGVCLTEKCNADSAGTRMGSDCASDGTDWKFFNVRFPEIGIVFYVLLEKGIF